MNKVRKILKFFMDLWNFISNKFQLVIIQLAIFALIVSAYAAEEQNEVEKDEAKTKRGLETSQSSYGNLSGS